MTYRVPSMKEINGLPWNGLKVVSTFAGIGGSSLGYRLAGFRVLYGNEFSPSAQEIYKINASPWTNLDKRDIREVSGGHILESCKLKSGELDIFDGSPPCFIVGTLILTRRGLIPIEQVRLGDHAVTHLGRWRQITAINARKSKVVSVRGQGHPGIVTTLEHPFFVRRMWAKYDAETGCYPRHFGVPEWRKIRQCLPGDARGHKANAYFWGMPRIYPPDFVPKVCRANSRAADIQLSEAFFWIVGLWLGDGWLRTGRAHVGVSNRGEVLICANKKQAAEVRRRLCDSGLQFSEAEMRTTIRFSVCHVGLADWLEEDFGRGAAGKTVASWAFGMPEDWRRGLLDGYVFADGTRPKTGGFRTSSISWSLTLGMAMIARTLGLSTTLRCQTHANNAVIENRRVNIAEASYALDCYDKPRSFLVETDRCWGRIKEINQVGSATVYNLSVADDESYLADGLIVHNCQAFSMSGTQKTNRGLAREHEYDHGATQKNADMFAEFVRLRDEMRPRAFVAENVPGLVRGVAKGYFLDILAELKRGYRVEARLLDAQWLGVPQRRQRLFFVGVRDDLGFDPVFPSPFSPRRTVRDALALPPRRAAVEPETDIARYAIGAEWDRLNPGQQSDKYFNLFRASWSEPAQTLTASAGDYLSGASVTHPAEKRKFAIWELKRICSFPDDFKMLGTYAEQYRGLGNCVPPLMTKAVAEALRDRVLIPARERDTNTTKRDERTKPRAPSPPATAKAASPSGRSPSRREPAPSGDG